MKFSIKNFFSKCDQVRGKLRIWSYLLKISLMENFISCVLISILYFYISYGSFEFLKFQHVMLENYFSRSYFSSLLVVGLLVYCIVKKYLAE